ncbi:hypothetical protein CLOSTASPAR_05343 [[Clostridium] asparagiforme DSM 15981]|uniref:Uncharacterized protein n=1 Tax=[Clostridium] asparagiforme DSM 15981 TaxID=518636 RepID=C0D7U6_9FIRM|nr:hypothetical protein CLOSTASPAR_05343 [[Clostridium] asparagiforme DSM 15981]
MSRKCIRQSSAALPFTPCPVTCYAMHRNGKTPFRPDPSKTLKNFHIPCFPFKPG